MEKEILEALHRIERLLADIKENTEKTASVVDHNYHELTDIHKGITYINEHLNDN